MHFLSVKVFVKNVSPVYLIFEFSLLVKIVSNFIIINIKSI